jgi:DNA-binding winged helix-turn-helix (wHTH) protein
MLLRFGDCALDPEALELRRGGEAVALSPRAFRLLLLLLQCRPRALSHQRLRDALWPDTLVGYTSLAKLVGEVRQAIGDRPEASPLVRTVARFGYAFVGAVSEEAGAAEPRFAGMLVTGDREYLVPAGEALVGRGESCRVRLPSARVSRVHARVRAANGRVTLEDAGSKNGTWVNGARLLAPVVLADGDEVLFGTFRAVFQGASATGSTRTGRPR